ncbi:MAG: DUF1761 domain-containing protein [Betaproteobacteria bacterium]|nr:DUF1761 domain-containing protein [Betaproteobacteria bacterium]
MSEINYWAVLVAAALSFAFGGLWYSPAMFGNLWNRENGSDPKGQRGHSARVFGVSLVLSVVAAAAFAYWLGPNPPLSSALGYGLVAGLGFVAACFGINYQFAQRSVLLWAVDGGYHVGQFLLFGLVLGLWH